MGNITVRELALQLLIRIEKESSFSHLLISDAMKRADIPQADENLLTEIVYGTIERKITLDYYLQPFIKNRKKLTDWVNILLRMSVYQMQFLERVPPYAIINEAVNIAKKKGHRGIGSFVNGVLRNIDRKGVRDVTKISDPIERLSIQTSHPKWLIERWVDNYGYEKTEKMCELNNEPKKITVRVNALKTTRDAMIEQFERAGIHSTACKWTKHGIIIHDGNIFRTDFIEKGYVTVQDKSSMLAVEYLDVAPEMHVLDTCSAPGGKASYIAEQLQNKGTVYANDLHENKLTLITHHAERLGLTNINVSKQDARKLRTIHKEKTFDRILIDAPCTGFGVIRSKPDIKYSKHISDIKTLQSVQLAILQEAALLLRETGKLIYSTCTVEIEENERVIEQFLQINDDFQVDEQFLEEVNKTFANRARITPFGLQLFPQSMDADGFFITRIIRINNRTEETKEHDQR